VSDYFDLGSYARPVTTTSDAARVWVQRGLVWAYAFNHEEAVACFEQAISADPQCALAHWGVAYALGPNYNKPWEMFEPSEALSVTARTHAATAIAQRLAYQGPVSGTERALIAALASRYPQGTPGPDPSVWNRAYADAMRTAYQEHRDDLDVAVLFADALMNLTPWALWDTATGQPAQGAATAEVRPVLERALATPHGRAHPGALHLYIHLMEMSPHPEEALWAGDLLRGLCPDAGHWCIGRRRPGRRPARRRLRVLGRAARGHRRAHRRSPRRRCPVRPLPSVQREPAANRRRDRG
jgi:tetratricopeptide (TPR) repeat protein